MSFGSTGSLSHKPISLNHQPLATLSPRSSRSQSLIGLSISGFGRSGIYIDTHGGNVIEGNFLGLNITGWWGGNNRLYGVEIAGSSNNRIGGTSLAARNIISSNLQGGVYIADDSAPSVNNAVQGNLIGTGVKGSEVIGNGSGGNGVMIYDAQYNTIGGPVPGAGNVISGSSSSGVYILGTPNVALRGYNVVQGNIIGLDVTGTTKVQNGGTGIRVETSDGNQIGGTTVGARNIISGNYQGGVYIVGGDRAASFSISNVVEGNWVGFDVTGSSIADANNGGVGVRASHGTRVAGNRIGNNSLTGVAIVFSVDTIVQGNIIGEAPDGSAAGNTDGVGTYYSQGTLVGGVEPGTGNVIKNNVQTGVNVSPDYDPISWWRAEGNADNATDANINTGTLQGGTDFARGKFGKAFHFDGIDDYVSVPDHPSLDSFAGFDAWIRPNDVNSIQQIISKFGTSGNGYQIGLAPNGVLRAEINVGTIEKLESPSGAIVPGRWTHIGMTYGYGADAWKLYVNGVEVASRDFVGGIGDVATPVSFGRKSDGTQYFDGLIDEPAIYDSEFNIPDIYRLGGVNKFRNTAVRGNAIANNILYEGIDLAGYGPDPNDIDDTDLGSNNLQNAPVITSAVSTGTQVTVTGTLSSIAYATYAIDIFDNSPPLPGPNPGIEGENFLGYGTVVTDANGNANFTLTFNAAIPVGHKISSTATVMLDDDANPATPYVSIETSEFGEPVSVTSNIVSGVKFHDLNRDGVRDTGEPGLQGWTVYLDANNNSLLDPTETRTTTDFNGGWSFANLPVGTYHAREIQSSPWIQTTSPLDFTVASTATSIFAGAIGNFRLASIGGAKFNDYNDNGILDIGEPGLAGWTIFLDANDNGTFDFGEAGTITDAFGSYSFDGLSAGQYRVREVQQFGWRQTTTNEVVDVLSNQSAQTFAVYVGNFQDGTGDGGDGNCDCCGDSPLVVNTVLDTIANDGVTSLREAILYANSHDNLLNAGGVRDVITFCIPGVGPHTIVPLTQLPTITEPVIIDGYSQAGASRNSLAVGDNAELKIQLDGQFAIGTGLTVAAGQSKIQGLAIYGFYNGIQLGIPNQPNPVGGNVVEGCFIGTDATGAVRRGNLDRGIWGVNTSNIRIGTNGDGVNDAGERNIILGNGSFGIFIESLGSVLSSSNVIAGNYIGTDRSGLITDPNGIQGDSDDLGNGMGIKLFTMTSTIANNVISGSLYYGVHIQGTDHQGATLAEHNAVFGNFIGTDVTGTQSLPNRVAGVAVEGAEFTTIGGTTVAARNIISGNIGIAGIHLNETFSTVVQGNYIGVDINGAPLGNTGSPFFLAGDGIEIQAGANNLIGGLTPGAGNVIANNEGAGVMVTANNFVPTSSGNTIRGNTIVNNGGLGIDISYLALGAAGVTGNDAGDTDVGPNGFQNFPLLASVSSTLAGTTITGTLNSTPLTTFTVDFYTNATGDPSGYGEGQTFLGSSTVSTDANGHAAYTVTLTTVAPVGQKVSATATDSLGSTSEFSGTTTVLPGFVAATISGQKFNDLDGNGLKSPGEPGIPGWTFFLDSNSNDVFDSGEPTQLTNINGDFTFGGLVAGTYRVREIPQQGWIQTSANPGEIVVASSGAIFGGLKFGNFQLGRISGQKFHDTDRDGVRDSAELPLSNIILYLDTDNDGVRDGDEIFTRTLADGSYSFNNLPAGMYHVREETPAGWVTTTPAIDHIVGSGDTFTHGLIGNFRLGSINGIKFNDVDGDGVASSGELGIPDWTIFLDGNGNNTLDPGEARTQTDEFGAYSFNLLEAGTYVVREVQQPGWIQTSINPAPILIVPNLSMQMPQANFGNFRLGSIEGGIKFHDVNRNGVKDSDELGLGGWMIFLDTDNDGSLDPGEATRVTDAAGNFSFGNLPAGVYHIREVQQPGWVQTTAPLDVTLSTSGQSLSAGAIGNFRLATINGVKFNDVNGDGIRQVGEAGLENWTIFLDANGNNTRDVGEVSTVTNASGGYSFENLGPGTYIVREMQQAGWTQTSLNPPPIIVSPNLSAQSFTANFGNLRGAMPSVIYGTKFLDVTGNGLTSDDTGMAGVQIKLYRDADNNGTLGSTDGPAVATMISAMNGAYSFGGLAPGRYFVQEGITPGFVRTGPTLATFYTVIVVAGSTNGPYNFANAEVCDKTCVDQCSVVYIINGCETVTDLRGHVDEGDVVEVRFRVVKAGETFSLVSYTAPASTFSASTAWQQVIFDSDTIAADTAKTYSLKVVVPNSYFQIDFVCGSPIDHFGPAGSNIFYSAQGRLFSADNDGTKTYTPSKLSGYVYVDANNNGRKETSEGGISGVTLTLSGVDIHGAAVTAVATTNSSGYYEFANLPASGPNGYRIVETHPADYLDGIDAIGSQGGESGNDFLSTSRLNSNTNGVNNNFGERQFASARLSGFVWLDANNDGDIDLSESAIDGAIVELFGTNDLGQVVQMSTTTDADGFYSFNNLRPGQYQLHELQPGAYLDGADSLGSLGGTLSNDLITQIALAAGADGVNYNFGERPAGTFLHHGQTATIGYWQNKNGQALLKSLNGGSTSCQLGNWLAVNFPNLYGSTAGSNNLAGKTNAYVAAYYISLFRQQGQKLEAQVLAVALAVYTTNSDLAGLTARPYGFEVTRSGTGSAFFNVGTSGQAFGVANNSVLSVIQILFATNAASRNGVVYASQYLRNLANVVYDGINQTGDI